MNRKLSMMLAGLLVTAMLTTAAFAEDVCVTKHGKRYHKVGSKFLKGKEFDVISREEAETRGYKPSSEFFPDDAAAKQNPSQEANAPVTSQEKSKKN